MRADAETDRGFTLIELLVVMAIAALVIVLAVPVGSRQRDRAELASSARTVAAALRLTRSRAIASDRAMVFIVDVGRGRFVGADGGVAGNLPPGASMTLMTAEEEAASESVGAIRFYPDGSSTGGGLAIRRNRDRDDVLVDWLTGSVSIHERHAPER